MVTFGEKYVERVEKALCETACLEHARQMPMTVDECWGKIRNLGFSEKVDRGFVEECYRRLDRDGHVRRDGDRYSLTDDGREDVQKIEGVLRRVVGEFGATTGARPGAATPTGTTGTFGGAPGATGGRPR